MKATPPPTAPLLLSHLLSFLLLSFFLLQLTLAQPPLNVLFIAADDLRNDLACYGHTQVKTPHLDRLAKRGMVFNRAYCQQAVCNPSRASLLSGRRPDRLRVWDLPTHFRQTSPDVVTLPQWFKHQGYFSQGIGKIFHNWRQDIQGDPLSWSVPQVMHYATHGSDKAIVEGALPKDLSKFSRAECRDVPDEAYFDGRIAAAGVTALEQVAQRAQPFFLAVGFWKPHLPFNPPKRYWDLYDRADFAPAPNSYPPENVPALALHNGRELLSEKGRDLTREEIVELRHGYLAGISYLDAQVGKLLDALDRLKLTDRTVIVFWSDHGFHLGEHNLWCKTSNFELDARVPLIIATPGMTTADQQTDALVELLDLYPTLVDLCGLPDPGGLEGRSLVPVLKDPASRVKDGACSQHPRPAYYKGLPEHMGVSVRLPDHRYTEWRDFTTGEVVASELYDHVKDPDENHNVIAETSPEVLARAKAALEQVFPRVPVTALKPEPAKVYHLEALRYGPHTPTADLGVGLWAWPMPMDWDGDGDLDLVVSCPDKPYNGTYFFENPGGGKLPVFKAGKKVGPGFKNITVSHRDGQAHVFLPGVELTHFRDRAFAEKTKIYTGSTSLFPGKLRANQWTPVDFDGDGDLDILAGLGGWSDYGWDDAYNEKGIWTNGPLHGPVYVITNTGTPEKPVYAKPRRLEAGGAPIDVYGMPSPNLADFDGDGDLDLLCGEFLDGFTYFQNTGTRQAPVYAAGRRLMHEGKLLTMDLQMIVPSAIDWDGDGDVDLIVGDEDGRVALVEHSGHIENGVPQFLPPVYFRQEAEGIKFGALSTPFGVDWDGDGDEDLLCGNTAGYIAFIENLDGGNPPELAEPRCLEACGEVLRIQAGPNGSIQGPCEAKWGYTTLEAADWDHDGRLDLIVNSIWGKVVWYRNVGSRTAPRLDAAQPITVAWNGKPSKPAWNWWQPDGQALVTQWRTTPVVNDLNRDGLNDLIMLDHEGYLALFRRERSGDGLILHPGERLFKDTKGQPLRLNGGRAGKSGRRKLALTDWDGDGDLDLLVNSVNADLYRNVSTPAKPWIFAFEGAVHERKLAGHTTSPTVVDWNRDGLPDLVLGAEDGRLYYMTNPSRPSQPQKQP
ncbi:MAG: arylsulfatase A-like enzyme [Kiritimatiellia bacterium]|jgi:arylsulfatase A-like enzyme